MSACLAKSTTSWLTTASALALAATGFCLTGSASAQTATQTAAQPEEVVVTGSRIGTPGFTTPTPVTEITPLQYELKEPSSVVEIMNDIPSLTPNQSISSSVDVGVSNFNLRNLGGTRTLVLVDGVRIEPTSVNGGFDVNTLPASLVKSMDIVTGGASAAYGSDAVAGVVNITLDTTLEGGKAKFSYGETVYGDSKTQSDSVAYGTGFDGGRGHIVIGGDYFTNAGLPHQSARAWGRTREGLLANPVCTTITTTCAQLLILPNTTNSKMTDGGVIDSPGPLQNIQFGPGGVLQPYQVGANAGATYMTGGSGDQLGLLQTVEPKVTRDNVLVHDSYDLTDDLSVWTEFRYTKSTEFYGVTPNYNNGDITITNQNPFIPTALATLMTANKITQFLMGRTNIDQEPIDSGLNLTYGLNSDYQGSGGLKGKIDALGTTWSWDVSAQYSSNEFRTSIAQNRNSQAWLNSIDAVANPTVGGLAGVPVGLAVCRSTLAVPTNGCVPVNLFGPNTIDSAVTNYTSGTSYVDAQLTQFLAGVNLRGEPLSTWAGPVSVAIGGEARRQTTNSVSDPLSQISGWRAANAIPYKGALSVQEGYFETDIPLAKNAPLAQEMDINAAARATSYSTSGGVTTWKVGLNYQPVDDVRLRGTRSHDIRAPNLTELFQNGVLRAGSTVTNPSNNVQSTASTITTGNPNLLPEIGDTITGGVIYSPSWLDGFNLSVDYWNIRLSGALATVTAQQVVNNCYAGQTSYCAAIGYDNTGKINLVQSTQFNAALLKTDGWDFEVGYSLAMDDLVKGWNGTLMLHALGTYVNHVITSSFGNVIDQAGCVGACTNPRLRYDINATWLNDPWQISVTGNWMGGGVYSQLYNGRYTTAQGGMTINNNKVDGRFYVNLTASYQVAEAWQIFGKVQNLFNSSPPLTPGTTVAQQAASSGLYDRIGTQFLGGVRVNF